MALALNKPKLDNLASDIWKSAERLRGKFKSYEYQSVILPIIVIRRLECVLIDWRAKKSAGVLLTETLLQNWKHPQFGHSLWAKWEAMLICVNCCSSLLQQFPGDIT